MRVAAVQTLGQFKDQAATDALLRLTGKGVKSEDVGVEAVLALGRQATPRALELLRTIATDPAAHQLDQRQAAVAGLALLGAGCVSMTPEQRLSHEIFLDAAGHCESRYHTLHVDQVDLDGNVSPPATVEVH